MPDQLKGLTQAEEMLIAKGCPVMRVYRLKGGQRGYGGHVVNLAQNIGDLVNSLPRSTRELPIIVVRRQGGEGIHKHLLVRRQRVFDALNWLKANNPFYSDISINTDNLNSLPDKGSLQDLYETRGDDDLDSERDTGPQQDGASGGDEDTESFLRSVVGNDMQEDAIVDIVWAPGEKAPALPEFVVLRLEGFTGSVRSSDPRYEGCVPIAPFETSWSTTGDDRGHETRQQIPLALCWAIPMHKSQGQTMDKAVVDLGNSESTAGLTFACLSRAKRLVDLLIEPMPLEKLSKIGDNPTFQLRLREEVRLNALAGDTLRLHRGVE